MTRTREHRWLVGGLCLLAGAALWGLMGVPGLPGGPGGDAAEPSVRLEPPATQAQVPAFVAGCRDAGRADTAQLRALADAEDPLVAGNAIAALGRLGKVHGDPALVARLHDPRPRVRHEVVLALGQSGDAQAAVHLAALLGGEDRQARFLAVHGLAQLGRTDLLDALQRDPTADAATRRFAEAARRQARVPVLLATTAGLQAR